MSTQRQAHRCGPDRSGHSGPRILFIGETAAISHVARPSMLASHLADRGYSVIFARDPRYNHLLRPDENVLQVDLNSISSAAVLQRVENAEPLYATNTLEDYVQVDLELMREFQPDIVVGDSRFSLIASSQIAGVPFVNIVDAHWSPYVDTKFVPMDTPVSRLIGVPLSDLMFHLAAPIALPFAFSIHVEPINFVLRKHRLPEVAPDIRAYFGAGDYVIYPNDPGLYRLSKRLPPEHAFIGPLLWSPQMPNPAWWDTLPADKAIVYVSLGSTGQPALLQTVLRVLGEFPVSVIAATAARNGRTELPDNVYLSDFIPGMEAAKRSRLVICNGGTMSGQQALSAGVPYLGLISNLDQMLYSRAVERAGACELIRESEVSEESLRRMVRLLLTEDRYRAAAQRIALRTAQQSSCSAFELFMSWVLRTKAPTREARARH